MRLGCAPEGWATSQDAAARRRRRERPSSLHFGEAQLNFCFPMARREASYRVQLRRAGTRTFTFMPGEDSQSVNKLLRRFSTRLARIQHRNRAIFNLAKTTNPDFSAFRARAARKFKENIPAAACERLSPNFL